MDREVNYRELIKRGMLEYRDISNQGRKDNIEAMCAFDDQAGQYLLVRVGWDGKRRFRQIVLHVRLHGGKIWIETDDTEDGFATALLKAGVPNSDIVLAFHPPHLRQYTDFAVA
jgi:XisI protein